MKNDNYKTGREGENIAAEFLKKKDFRILERNYRFQRSEIDIIGLLQKELVFVEVKTRSNTIYGLPYEAVDMRKINKIRRIAQHYVNEKRLYGMDIRFDVISIIIGKDKEPQIEHIEYAF